MNAPAFQFNISDPAAVAAGLRPTLSHFGEIRWVHATGSTNGDLLAQARETLAPPRPWLLGAHLQEAGRGRAGRPWRSATGECLTVSCAFDVDLPPHRLPSLSPLAGLAACEALRAMVPARADALRVKWPNDIQWDDRKLAGILVESMRNPSGPGQVVVIGMGMNLHNADAVSQALGREVADWSQVRAEPCDATTVVPLASALAHAWEAMIQALSISSFSAFAERYAAVDALAGHTVDVKDQGHTLFSGRAEGCDDFGRLRVRTAQGVTPVAVGDVSVRTRQ